VGALAPRPALFTFNQNREKINNVQDYLRGALCFDGNTGGRSPDAMLACKDQSHLEEPQTLRARPDNKHLSPRRADCRHATQV